MPNPFYNHSNGIPITQSRGASAAIRSELDGVAAGFDGVKTVQDAQATTLTTKANKAGDTYTGVQNFTGATVTAPTKTLGDSSSEVATTAFIATALALKANLASPGLTGTPTAPTASLSDNSTQIATTAFTFALISSAVLPGGLAATSTTSLTVGTGSRSLTIQAGKVYSPGQAILVADTSAPATNWMFGQIITYDTNTGALVVSVNTTNGSGTIAAWTVSLSSNPSFVVSQLGIFSLFSTFK